MKEEARGGAKCECGARISARQVGDDLVTIETSYPNRTLWQITDTMAAWIAFRDDIKNGKYDHIGQ